MQAAGLAALIARETIIRNSRKKPHEADVMMESRVAIKGAVELVFHPAGDIGERVIARGAEALPKDSRPKAVGPPDQVLGRGGHVLLVGALFRNIGNLGTHAVTLGGKTVDEARNRCLCPSGVLDRQIKRLCRH